MIKIRKNLLNIIISGTVFFHSLYTLPWVLLHFLTLKKNPLFYFDSECPWLIICSVSSDKSLHLFCKSQSSPINPVWHFYSLQDWYINNIYTACLPFIEFHQGLFVDSLWRKVSRSNISNVHWIFEWKTLFLILFYINKAWNLFQDKYIY